MRETLDRASQIAGRALADRGVRAGALALIVGAAALYHWVQAQGRATPWIFPDELRYAEFERAIAGRGRHGVLGELDVDGILHVVLLAPAWLLGTTEASYQGVQALNALVFAAAAIPVFLLARRVTGPLPALLAAAGAVAIPAAFYASTLMQEPVAYTAAMVVALAVARAVEAPTPRRLILAFGLAAAAFLVRGQLGVLVAAAAFALLADALAAAARGERPRLPLVPLAATVAVGLAGALAAAALVGSAGSALSGIASDPRLAASVAVESLGVTVIAVAVVPAVAGVLLMRELGSDDRPRAALAATVLAVAVAMTLYTVGKSASLDYLPITRLEERNLIYLEPLLLVAIPAVAGRVRWPAAAAAAALVAVLVATLPLSRLATGPILSEAPGLSWIYFEGRSDAGIAAWVLVALVVAAALGGAALLARPAATVAGGAVVLALLVAGTYTYRGDHQVADEFAARFVPADPQWVDTAASGRRVAVLLNADASEVNRTWTMAFWNRSIWSYAVRGVAATGLAVEPTTVGPEGLFSGRGATLVLHPATIAVGEPTGVAESIWRLSDASEAVTAPGSPLIQPGLIRIAAWITGRFPDGWVGGSFTVQRFIRTRPGVVRVALSGENPHVSSPRTVTARVPGGATRTIIVRPGTTTVLAVPVAADAFAAQFAVEPALSPGPNDPRLLSLQLIGVEIPGVGVL